MRGIVVEGHTQKGSKGMRTLGAKGSRGQRLDVWFLGGSCAKVSPIRQDPTIGISSMGGGPFPSGQNAQRQTHQELKFRLSPSWVSSLQC